MTDSHTADEEVPAAIRCAVCGGIFIDHRHGALGHDWMPKPPAVNLSPTDVEIAQGAAVARGERYGY